MFTWRENLSFWITIVATIGGVFAFILLIAYAGTAWSCNRYSEVTGKQTKMGALSCYVKDGDKWYIWEEYKYRFVTKGEM